MNTYHIIKPSGEVITAEWTEPLLYGCIPFSEIAKLAGIGDVEHVTVLWKGKRSHMFVDENGLALGLPPNLKATRIYFNASFKAIPRYDNLAESPKINPDILSAKAREAIMRASMIVGTALLWEGDME